MIFEHYGECRSGGVITPASVKDFAARLAGPGIAAGAIASPKLQTIVETVVYRYPNRTFKVMILRFHPQLINYEFFVYLFNESQSISVFSLVALDRLYVL